MKPPLRAVQYFETVARLNSFSAAAEELAVTQSAVSHQVRLLEDFLGEQLFVRQGRKLALTVVGQSYFDEISPAIQTISGASLRVREGEQGTIRLTIYSSLAVKWLIPRLEQLRRQYPEINLSLNMVADDPEINDNMGDCFISIRPPKTGYVCELLYAETLYPVCSPRVWKEIEGKPLPDALWDYPLLSAYSALREKGKDWQTWAKQGGFSLPVDARLNYFSHMLLAVEAARYDQGITFVNGYLLSEQDKEQYLVKIPLHDVATGDVYYFICKPSRARQPDIVKLKNWLKQQSIGL
uniref:LysR substrate-binding domain-containing protein n=1 Tax=Thaumasiovibrio occultus TaxID=1891184 RepID=UPI000B360AD4|nr:LysR substrate-binding domain-containing protein [Thaumasiovibrio occultus]